MIPFGDRSRLAEARYWASVFWFPVLCLLLMGFAFRQAGAADGGGGDRELVEQPAPSTPVLSARRVPNLVALPNQAGQLVAPMDQLLGQLPRDSTCLVVTSSRAVPLYLHNPSMMLSPASTMKVLTGYGALTQLGPDRTFGTYLATDAQITNGILQGDLWLIGTGDPVLATDDYVASFAEQPQVRTRFEDLVEQLRSAGVTRIQGNVIGDATRYDNVRYPQTWPGRFANQQVAGPQSALLLNRGWVAFPAAGQELAGSGNRTASADPPRDAANRLATLLRAAGVQIDGGVNVGPVPQTPNFLAQVQSPPLRDIVATMMANSDNTVAEMLFKELGAVRAGQATTAGGAAAMDAILTERGLTWPGMVIRDGSGLDPGNQLPCAVLNAAMNAVGRFSDLVEGMAVSNRTGTLADRFEGSPAAGRVYAKTGSLDDVAALAGFVDTTKGDVVGFAIIVNGSDAERFRPVADGLAESLVDFPPGPPISELGPRPV